MPTTNKKVWLVKIPLSVWNKDSTQPAERVVYTERNRV